MRHILTTVCAAILLSACSGSGTSTTSPPASPLVTIVATETGLTAAGTLAMNYVTLPICTGANGPLCADPTIKAQVKNAYDMAYDAVTAAQTVADAGGTPDLTAATAAVTVLKNLLATVPAK
jgi:hypothetical protein